jgi:glycosyltransferase involved in cell wall biosynthesis
MAIKKIIFVVNVDWFLISHRMPVALAAKNQGFEVHVATSVTTGLKELTHSGFTVHQLNVHRSSANPFMLIIYLWRLIHLFFLLKPDVAHLITMKPVIFGGIAARLCQVPSVVVAIAGLGHTFVGISLFSTLRRKLIGWLLRFAFRQKNLKVIFQNESDKKAIERIVPLADTQTTLIPGSGVDLTQFSAGSPPFGLPVVMFAARLLKDKGVVEFVEAARFLKSQCLHLQTRARFVLVGEPDFGNPASVTNSEITNWVTEGTIEYWGFRPDMSNVISTATIVTLPSYYGEGLPKVLIEAAACGRAVVTTDHPGCRDAIEPGVSGLLVPVRDPLALGRAIGDLLVDPAKCSEMGRAGRLLAERKFDVNRVVSDHLDIYSELTAQAAR